jgi:hypothetical protein
MTTDGLPTGADSGIVQVATGLKMEKCLNVVAHGVVLVVRRVDNYAYVHVVYMWLVAMSRIYVRNLADLVDDGSSRRSGNLLQEILR